MKKFAKIKTISQLEKEFGSKWRSILLWNRGGDMDHLAGKTLLVRNYKGFFFICQDKETNREWGITDTSVDYYFTLKDKINKLLEL